MAFNGNIFGRLGDASAQPATSYGLGSRRRPGMRGQRLGGGFIPPPKFPSLGAPSYRPQSSGGSLGSPTHYTPPVAPVQSQPTPPVTPVQSQPSPTPQQTETIQPVSEPPTPFDPFGTQASGGQYGNLSGTPAIFGASDYGQFQNQGTQNTSPEAQAILARTQAAAMGNFNQGLNVLGQPTSAGASGPQMGQTLGDNQWNGTGWVPRNYGAPQTGFFGGSNPGGY